MEDLYHSLLAKGYSKEQVEAIFRILYQHIDSRYPILAKLAEKEFFALIGPTMEEAA